MASVLLSPTPRRQATHGIAEDAFCLLQIDQCIDLVPPLDIEENGPERHGPFADQFSENGLVVVADITCGDVAVQTLGDLPQDLAFDFPDQNSTFAEVDLRYTRKLTGLVSVGIAYLYEDWTLDDFQVENLQPYGADFLSVDDGTRYLFLDSWYGDYSASVGQVFLVIHLD